MNTRASTRASNMRADAQDNQPEGAQDRSHTVTEISDAAPEQIDTFAEPKQPDRTPEHSDEDLQDFTAVDLAKLFRFRSEMKLTSFESPGQFYWGLKDVFDHAARMRSLY